MKGTVEHVSWSQSPALPGHLKTATVPSLTVPLPPRRDVNQELKIVFSSQPVLLDPRVRNNREAFPLDPPPQDGEAKLRDSSRVSVWSVPLAREVLTDSTPSSRRTRPKLHLKLPRILVH